MAGDAGCVPGHPFACVCEGKTLGRSCVYSVCNENGYSKYQKMQMKIQKLQDETFDKNWNLTRKALRGFFYLPAFIKSG